MGEKSDKMLFLGTYEYNLKSTQRYICGVRRTFKQVTQGIKARDKLNHTNNDTIKPIECAH